MVKIEAESLEDAYLQAAQQLTCSVTELDVVVIQRPKKKVFGLLGKNAIIVANCKVKSSFEREINNEKPTTEDNILEDDLTSVEKFAPLQRVEKVVEKVVDTVFQSSSKEENIYKDRDNSTNNNISINTILPEFLSKKDKNTQKNSDVVGKVSHVIDNFFEDKQSNDEISIDIKDEINTLFNQLCFSLNVIEVSMYDDSTLLIEFTGEDAALLIGKEGYRYKALSYMLFNWINSKYKLQLRLEIAEFLKNQEESISRYLISIYEDIDREGSVQTKVLDGVLVQIALKQLRERYHDKYVAIRSTRDGGKYIIVNEYNRY